jgi:hypothetical protein
MEKMSPFGWLKGECGAFSVRFGTLAAQKRKMKPSTSREEIKSVRVEENKS